VYMYGALWLALLWLLWATMRQSFHLQLMYNSTREGERGGDYRESFQGKVTGARTPILLRAVPILQVLVQLASSKTTALCCLCCHWGGHGASWFVWRAAVCRRVEGLRVESSRQQIVNCNLSGGVYLALT